MAAESSSSTTTRTASPSVDSYVGSLISLVSNSEIRYQGFLFNIDTAESRIGLRDVKSFGTEGRRKNGPQVPPSDKVYEYILFRGSDIKDLQVKSASPVQTKATIFNDPAIVQSCYPREAAASMSMTPPVDRSQQDLSSYSMGPHQSTPQSSLPLYQPGGGSGSWITSYPYPTSNGSVPTEMYMQGFYGVSDEIQTQQQSSQQLPPGLLARPFVQQKMQYPASSATLSTSSFNLPDSTAPDTPPPLLPSFSASTLPLHSFLLPAQSSALPSDSSSISMPNTASIQALRTTAITTSLQLENPPTNVFDKNSFAPHGTVQPKITDSMISYNSIFESECPVMDKSTSFVHKGLVPPLVKPNQFLQPRPTVVSASQSLQAIQNDVVVVPVSSMEQPIQNFPDTQAPILHLPTPLDCKVYGDPSQSHHQISRGGHGRGRDHWSSDNVSNFTEEFDFVTMNEKFNKDEVWGHLGKANTPEEDGYSPDRDTGISNFEPKAVYVKDDFFDSLSSNTIGGPHNGRSAFSERRKLNTKTLGNFPRHRLGRGFGRSGRGFDRGSGGFGHSGHGLLSGHLGFEGDGYGNSRGGHGYGRSGRGSHSGGANYGRGYSYNERGGWGNHAI